MLVEHRLLLGFERSHVQEPLICEMVRLCPGVMLNIDTLSVGPLEARMEILLAGTENEVHLLSMLLLRLRKSHQNLHPSAMSWLQPYRCPH